MIIFKFTAFNASIIIKLFKWKKDIKKELKLFNGQNQFYNDHFVKNIHKAKTLLKFLTQLNLQRITLFMFDQQQSRGEYQSLMSHYFLLFYCLFCVHLYRCLVLNCLFLVHFHQLGFIAPLFRILINLTLICLIFVSNYF